MDWKTLVGFTVIFHGIVYLLRKEWILRLDTRKLNGFFNSLGTHKIRKYLRIWFRLGTYVTIVFGFPFTLWLFLRTIYNCLLPSVVSLATTVSPSTIFSSDTLELHHEQPSLPDADLLPSSSSSSSSSPGATSSYLALQPIFPGWNLPLSHLPYYLIAILISVVIHELGHAIASASHQIPVLSVGFSFFGPLIPAAHVELNSVQLKEAKFKKQLDILTAGVWMNLYLALITYFVMPRILPALLWPTHSTGTGLAVTNILANSGAGGPSGLQKGDVIIGIENCPVHDLDSWLTCLEDIWKVDPIGFCLDNDSIVKLSNNSEDCCSPNKDNSPTHLCFIQTVGSDSKIPSPSEPKEPIVPGPNNSNDIQKQQQPEEQHLNHSSLFCLPAQSVITANATGANKCSSPEYKCSSENSESHCVIPQIVRDYKRFRTVHIHRRQHHMKESVLFVGDVYDLANGLRTTEFIPRDFFLSRLFGYGKVVMLSVQLETVLLLTSGLSAGLAIVNMLPVYGLDGYHVVDAIVRHGFAKRLDGRQISKVVNAISWTALFVALLTVVCSVVQSVQT